MILGLDTTDLFITLGLLAVAAALAATIVCTPPGWGLLAVAALTAWLTRRARAHRYHRARFRHAKCHAKPTRRRARALARRAASERTSVAPARVASTPTAPHDTVPISKVVALPDIRQFARHA